MIKKSFKSKSHIFQISYNLSNKPNLKILVKISITNKNIIKDT